jgi:transposase
VVEGLKVVMMPGDDVLPKPEVRRIEVFTGAGRRRRWSAEAKAQIVAESYATSVGEVAERYSLRTTQIFTWPRDACRAGGAGFAPVVLADVEASGADEVGVIEVRIGEVLVRIPREADPRMAAAVIAALKAAR